MGCLEGEKEFLVLVFLGGWKVRESMSQEIRGKLLISFVVHEFL
jgi:hypothetical protein